MCQWCNHRFQAKKKKILIWVKHLPILPPEFFIEVKHNKIMGPLRGDVGTKQKSHVKYFISLWGSFIIFSFFKMGVDISKWSGINDFNFTFIEGSSAKFLTPLEMTIYQGSNTTQFISLEFILGHSCWSAEGPLGPTQFPLGFCPQWGGEADVKRYSSLWQRRKKSYARLPLTWLIGDWLYEEPSGFWKKLEGLENN